MPKSNRTTVPLWKIALRLGFIFIVILTTIKFFWNWMTTGNFDFLKNAFDTGNWIKYLIFYCIAGIIYGFSIGYYYQKQNSKN